MNTRRLEKNKTKKTKTWKVNRGFRGTDQKCSLSAQCVCWTNTFDKNKNQHCLFFSEMARTIL